MNPGLAVFELGMILERTLRENVKQSWMNFKMFARPVSLELFFLGRLISQMNGESKKTKTFSRCVDQWGALVSESPLGL